MLLFELLLRSVDLLLSFSLGVAISQLLILLVDTVRISITLTFLDHSVLLEGCPDLAIFIERLLVYIFFHSLVLQGIIFIDFIHFPVPLRVSIIDHVAEVPLVGLDSVFVKICLLLVPVDSSAFSLFPVLRFSVVSDCVSLVLVHLVLPLSLQIPGFLLLHPQHTV